MSINKVIICGLGAVGVTFGSKMLGKCDLRILVDKARLEKYTKTPHKLNEKDLNFEYILPDENFPADLIIISTKSFGLNSAIEMIKNFVNKNTIIISLLNGITSEEIIQQHYPEAKVLKSYFIGHSAVRNENNITQDGVGEIVCEKNDELNEFFKRVAKIYVKFIFKSNICHFKHDFWRT